MLSGDKLCLRAETVLPTELQTRSLLVAVAGSPKTTLESFAKCG